MGGFGKKELIGIFSYSLQLLQQQAK